MHIADHLKSRSRSHSWPAIAMGRDARRGEGRPSVVGEGTRFFEVLVGSSDIDVVRGTGSSGSSESPHYSLRDGMYRIE